MKVNIDTMQRIKGGGIFMLEFYKILMGTFLTIFVPRDCGDRVCTLTDNYKDDEIFHRFVFGFNSVCFFIVMILYYTEIKRENWCITYLDIDENNLTQTRTTSGECPGLSALGIQRCLNDIQTITNTSLVGS